MEITLIKMLIRFASWVFPLILIGVGLYVGFIYGYPSLSGMDELLGYEYSLLGIFVSIALTLFGIISLFSAQTGASKAIVHLDKIEKQTYTWYVKTYPHLVSDDHVRCSECNSKAIGSRVNKYAREHFCNRCGHILYFSNSDL